MDPRFARLKTDPRFRKPKTKRNKVVVDERFKSIFEDTAKAGGKGKARIDKYGRAVSKTRERDDLRRFYRLEGDEEKEESLAPAPDYARGEGLLESSDEEAEDLGDNQEHSSESSDGEEPVALGRDIPKPRRHKSPEDILGPEIDLDESQFDILEKQASAFSKKADEEDEVRPSGSETSRIAVVNLDWDHVRASHLFKVFDSVVSNTGGSRHGKVLSVRVYPSQFGKERMAREEKEGPPLEVFRKKGEIAEEDLEEDDINEETIFQQGQDGEYDDDALRKYQLERLRYYYAIVSFDSASAAAVAYGDLDGTELERSANMFDLSYVPEHMKFEDDFRDECTNDTGVYNPLDFVTDALRHSKVKLTWDDDDAARSQITRRALTRKQVDENDFKAYIASSGSSSSEGPSDNEAPNASISKKSRAQRRDKLRALLLNGDDNDELPEGWGGVPTDKGELEVTFMPGLSNAAAHDGERDETTLERYQRKQKEKKMARKAAQEAKSGKAGIEQEGDSVPRATAVKDDDFFGDDNEKPVPSTSKDSKSKKPKRNSGRESPPADSLVQSSTREELELLLAPDRLNEADGPKHFSMKEVLRAEKGGKRKHKKGRGKKRSEEDGGEKEDGSGFSVDVADPRFAALHEQPEFAIDPSNPQFKATKSMSALLQERSRRRKDNQRASAVEEKKTSSSLGGAPPDRDINSLVQSVKRKSKVGDAAEGRGGKRHKV